MISGVGIVFEDSERRPWNLLQRLTDGARTAVGALFDPAAVVRSRDDKLLSREDLLAIQAAQRSIADAFGTGLPSNRKWGCVSFTTSKLTRANELTLPFVKFRNPDHTVDTRAFRNAIDQASIQIDPLRLVRLLDNSVNWWLCKTHGFGETNLQLGQCLNPDLWALVAGIDLVTSGECDSVLVGGAQTFEQSVIHRAAFSYEFPPASETPAGDAGVFFVIEREDLVDAGRRPYARLKLELPDEIAASAGHATCALPGLATAIELLESVLSLRKRGRGEALQALSTTIGPFTVEGI